MKKVSVNKLQEGSRFPMQIIGLLGGDDLAGFSVQYLDRQFGNRTGYVYFVETTQTTITIFKDEEKELVIELRPVRPLRRITDQTKWKEKVD